MSNTWSVRGVSPDLRRNIVEAADRAGITVAEWLDHAVAPALQTAGGPVPPHRAVDADSVTAGRFASGNVAYGTDAIISAIDGCLDRLDALSLPREDSRGAAR